MPVAIWIPQARIMLPVHRASVLTDGTINLAILKVPADNVSRCRKAFWGIVITISGRSSI